MTSTQDRDNMKLKKKKIGHKSIYYNIAKYYIVGLAGTRQHLVMARWLFVRPTAHPDILHRARYCAKFQNASHPLWRHSNATYSLLPASVWFGSGLVITKAQFVNFSESKIFDLAKVSARLF